ncbi:hypothetical protein RHGRI_010387 [Rhododendron griersonianum]|uniref:Uncharacterized protein n=1 Tax=Rhododendron griersonianum TaxID=479676 RepID=A0AAV6KJ63_9ERIC|nr:hypothetical protein RHGRI_010387 [Rhododendron griersonianum]
MLILYTILCLTHSWGPFGLQLAGWLARQVPVVRACPSCCESGLLFIYFRDSCKLYSF